MYVAIGLGLGLTRFVIWFHFIFLWEKKKIKSSEEVQQIETMFLILNLRKCNKKFLFHEFLFDIRSAIAVENNDYIAMQSPVHSAAQSFYFCLYYFFYICIIN